MRLSRPCSRNSGNFARFLEIATSQNGATHQDHSHPKFYLFVSGVVRALSGRLPYPGLQLEEQIKRETPKFPQDPTLRLEAILYFSTVEL